MTALIAAFAAGLALLLFYGVLAWPTFDAIRYMRRLSELHPDSRPSLAAAPRVSVIVPACNEESAIERCLRSLARQDYPDLEVIAVNDRSTDLTGDRMEAVSRDEPRVHVIHVADLPTGWLGKNHANHVGAARAAGDWILFTDGDVTFEPDAVRRAVLFAEAERLDHLAVFPGMEQGGFWETAAVYFFVIMYVRHTRLWHARNPLRPDAFAGVGAFNLVRRDAYQAIGGHRTLCMEVVDDLKLAKLVKHAGCTTDALDGHGMISVRWQVGLRGVIRGLEKNAFAGAGYRLGRAAGGVLMLALFAVMPPCGALLAPSWSRLPFALVLLGQIALLGLVSVRRGGHWSVGLAYPVVCLALAWAVGRSIFLTMWRRGVQWRGTFYPLEELRRGSI